MCGEQGRIQPCRTNGLGSSPRVRGTADYAHRVPYRLRFIPACAGNSPVLSPTSCESAVHPRVCGEQDVIQRHIVQLFGSSPRVRGTDTAIGAVWSIKRFIPACAGNSVLPACPAECMPVHPRVCGEQVLTLRYASSGTGSSPRVRGTGIARHFAQEPNRFIPACAGNSFLPIHTDRRLTVHPRVCGEQLFWLPAMACFVGSSPRVRGTELTPQPKPHWRRFIPACAGNRTFCIAAIGWQTVHPRVCGEQGDSTELDPVPYGSSPRVRGTDRR